MKKLSYPPFLTLLATIIATVANKVFGIHVDLNMAVGALAVVGNYLVMQFAVDIQRLKRGELPQTKFNSVKFYTAMLVAIALGLCNYFNVHISQELVSTWAIMAMTIITGKGIVDMKQDKKEANPVDSTFDHPVESAE